MENCINECFWKATHFTCLVQSLQALGHLAFIGAVDLEATEATMELLWSLINHRRSVEDQVLHSMLE